MAKLTTEQLKEIKTAMLKVNFKYKQINGIHNFLNVAIREGIEVKGDTTVNPFWVDTDDTRVYGLDPVGNETRAAVLAIEEILNKEEQEAPEPVVNELKPVKAEIVPQDQLYGIIPQYLTDELINKHRGTISELISMQKTDINQIQERKGASGKMLSYVDTAYMTTALNWASLMDWSFEVLETRTDIIEKKTHISVLGCVTMHTTDGKTIQKQQWGSQVLKAKMEMGDALKAAASDAMKKCASMFGIAADVYAGAV